jgi:hypothetical protein
MCTKLIIQCQFLLIYHMRTLYSAEIGLKIYQWVCQ